MVILTTSLVAAELRAACGPEAVERLTAAFGGQRIDVPRTPRGKLMDALGPEITRFLALRYGGTAIDVPSAGHAERMSRAMALKADILTGSFSPNQLATRHGVTAHYVRKVRRNIMG